MVNFVLLLANGDIKDIQIQLPSKYIQKPLSKILSDKRLGLSDKFLKEFDNIGKGKLTELHIFDKLDSEYSLVAYGYKKGIVENNHEIPYISDNMKVYGDILISKMDKNNNLLDINSNFYEEIYNNLFYSDQKYNIDNYDEDIDEEDEDIEDDVEDDVEDVDVDVDVDVEDDVDEDEEDEEDEEDVDNEFDEPIDIDELESLDENDDNDEDMEFDDMEDDINIELRVKNIELFEDLLNNNKLAKLIEDSIFRYTNEKSIERKVIRKWDNPVFRKIYINKSRSIYSNINPDSYIKNNTLFNKIKKNKIMVDTIAYMSYQEY